jgi:nitronate monooxygenase
MMQFPKIIQGGMGVGVSNWRLANVVSKLGQLGVVSGTALDSLFVRRLNEGDPGGNVRRGLDAFPFPEMAQRIWDEYYIPGGKAATVPYALPPMHQRRDLRKVVELCIVSNFVEVYLARDGHKNPVGINFLEKVQMPHLASIFGAMLAGVGYVLMGAGIPLHIPGVLDALAGLRPAHYHLAVTGASQDQDTAMSFDPADHVQGPLPQLDRPKFLAIVSSNTLATTMLRRATGRVDGLVIESPIAGGHNAPPRGKLLLNANGEPIYGERDLVDIAGLRALGVPFWLAGGYGNAKSLRFALDQGAAGVQVGTAFAFSEESGLRPDLKNELLAQAVTNSGVVFTDPLASPAGFPFKVAILQGSYSEAAVAEARTRVCDIGLLRESYIQPNGNIGYRCSAEPVANFVAKGGRVEETVGRKCLCNALMANIGHQQVRKDGSVEPPLITVGDDLNTVAQFLAPGRTSYTAADVITSLLSLTADGAAADEQDEPVYATA